MKLCFSSPGFSGWIAPTNTSFARGHAGAEHFGPADGDALAVFVAHAGNEELVGLFARRSCCGRPAG